MMIVVGVDIVSSVVWRPAAPWVALRMPSLCAIWWKMLETRGE